MDDEERFDKRYDDYTKNMEDIRKHYENTGKLKLVYARTVQTNLGSLMLITSAGPWGCRQGNMLGGICGRGTCVVWMETEQAIT